MTITVYRHDDADAPILTTDAPGAMLQILRKCLVDGYGTGAQEKPAAGWEMVWDDDTNQRAAFRSLSPASSGFWLYVDDRGAATGFAGGNRWARVWGMETFGGWDASGDPIATGRFPLSTQSASGVTIYKSSQETATPSSWEIVADDRGFWLLVDGYRRDNFSDNSSYGGGEPHYFGDFTSASGGASSFAMCGRAIENNNSPGFNQDLLKYASSDRAGCYLSYSHDGQDFSVGMGHHSPYSAAVPYPDPITGALQACQPLLMQDGNKYVGQIPGLLASMHDHFRDAVTFPHGTEVEIAGRLHRLIRAPNYITAWLDVEGPWHGA